MSCLDSSYNYRDKEDRPHILGEQQKQEGPTTATYTPYEQQRKEGTQTQIEELNQQLQEQELQIHSLKQ